MKQYKYNEWEIENITGSYAGSFDERIYVDLEGNLITGMLEGFYGYTNNQQDSKNFQYVEKGKRCQKPKSLI